MIDINPFFDTNEGVLKAENFAQVFNMLSTLAGEGVPLSTEMDKTIVFKIDHHDDTGVPKLAVSLEGGQAKIENGLPEISVGSGACIKTGCVAEIGGSIYRGDLFDLGEYLLLNCEGPPSPANPMNTAGLKFHLIASTFSVRLRESKVLTLHRSMVFRFDYDGFRLEPETKAPSRRMGPLSDVEVLHLIEGEEITSELYEFHKQNGCLAAQIGQNIWDLSDGPVGQRVYSEPFYSLESAIRHVARYYPKAKLVVDPHRPES